MILLETLPRSISNLSYYVQSRMAILFILSFLNFSVWWQAILGLYLIFEIGNSMFSSKRDLEGVLVFLAAIFVVGSGLLGVLYFLRPLLVQNIWIYLNATDLSVLANFFKQSNIYLLIPLALDLVIIFITKIIRRGVKIDR